MWQQCTANCSDCQRRRQCEIVECLSGCDCLPGYFRVESNGSCQPVAQCPRPDCGPNEVFRECGPACERCSTPVCRMISCDHRCYCKQGHLRNKEGACVPREECPKRSACTPNEEWLESGAADEYCLKRGEGTREEPGCYCKQGFKRNHFGSCVTSCTFVKCYGLSVYHDCVPRCNATCSSDPSWCEEEDEDCYPGCFCPPGRVMNELNHCILHSQCSTKVEVVTIVRGPGIVVDDLETTTPGGEITTPGPSETEVDQTNPPLTDTTPDFENEDI